MYVPILVFMVVVVVLDIECGQAFNEIFMKSSWSIHDFPPEEGEVVIPKDERFIKPVPPEKRRLTFEEIRNRKDRKGRGARMRAGEKKWATKGK